MLLKEELREVFIEEDVILRMTQRWFIKVSGCLLSSITLVGVYFVAANHNHLVAFILLTMGIVLFMMSLFIRSGREFLIDKSIWYEAGKNELSYKLANKQASRLKKLYRHYKFSLFLLTLALSIPCLFYLWLVYQLSIH